MVHIRGKEENSELQYLILEEVAKKLCTDVLLQRQHTTEKDKKMETLEAEVTTLNRKGLYPGEDIDYRHCPQANQGGKLCNSMVCPFKGQKS